MTPADTRTPADTWATSTDPEELLRLAGPLTRDEASAIVSDAYERVEHLVTVEEMETAPQVRVRAGWPPHPPMTSSIVACLAWARRVEVAFVGIVPATPEVLGALTFEVGRLATLAQAAMVRRAVRFPRT